MHRLRRLLHRSAGLCLDQQGRNRDDVGFAEISMEEFQKRYVRLIGIRKSLIELANGDCVFFDNHRRCCQVYEARPRQCRTWPFWSQLIISPIVAGNRRSLSRLQSRPNHLPGTDRSPNPSRLGYKLIVLPHIRWANLVFHPSTFPILTIIPSSWIFPEKVPI